MSAANASSRETCLACQCHALQGSRRRECSAFRIAGLETELRSKWASPSSCPIGEQPGDADLQLSHPCQQIEGRPKILEVPGRSRGAMLCSSVTATFVSSFEHLACN